MGSQSFHTDPSEAVHSAYGGAPPHRHMRELAHDGVAADAFGAAPAAPAVTFADVVGLNDPTEVIEDVALLGALLTAVEAEVDVFLGRTR